MDDLTRLLEDLESREGETRRRARDTLKALGNEALPGLCRALRHGTPRVRRRAARILGLSTDSDAFWALTQAVANADNGTRLVALNSAIRVALRSTVGFLRALGDKDSPLRRRIGDSLVATATPFVPNLCGLLTICLTPARGLAAYLLGAIGDPRAVEPLCETLKDKEAWIRGLAADSLRKIGDLRAVEPLCRAIGDTDAGVRVNVARALGTLDDPRTLEPLSAALKDPSHGVRQISASALERRATPESVPSLCEALGDNSGKVRAPCARALTRIAREEPVPALRAAVPHLRRLTRIPVGRDRDTYRAALEEIERATETLKDLPVPAAAPHALPDELPVPAEAPHLGSGDLPLPSDEEALGSEPDSEEEESPEPEPARQPRSVRQT